ncbi:hypothetical protein [Pseudochrobactrum sp. MP213Fo]|uniref:hypothetical protein n=1 Tax=Pseudochrobactrum sp. MP213Fo TaxID=3022250 RepID=UPI003BA02F9B
MNPADTHGTSGFMPDICKADNSADLQPFYGRIDDYLLYRTVHLYFVTPDTKNMVSGQRAFQAFTGIMT